MSASGSCLCGEVNFEIDGDFESFYLCHCQYCQKDTGSTHASNLFSSVAKLIWRSGQENIKTYKLPSTKHIRSFCSNCGSALPSVQMNDKLLVVPAGSLNENISIKPNAHIFTASRANWDCELESIKSYKQFPQ
ncbi:GFA family protein [Thalassotalea sp. G2M2-11]|uniref:GFA family protein n=1 Tax=Thalassotalea sp. G2M2-11 TaxID=2787627 RepID=UPI0019D00125|nr:GFA family protein [Thalassotalea sp. G2M2-11]